LRQRPCYCGDYLTAHAALGVSEEETRERLSEPGRSLKSQVKRALVAAGITLALSVATALAAAAATSGSESTGSPTRRSSSA
jgi:hypothetical protein